MTYNINAIILVSRSCTEYKASDSWFKKDRYVIDSDNLYFTFKLSSDQTISNAFLLLFVFASRCGRSEIKLHGYFFLLLFTTFRFYFLYQEPPEAAKPSLLSKGVYTN